VRPICPELQFGKQSFLQLYQDKNYAIRIADGRKEKCKAYGSQPILNRYNAEGMQTPFYSRLQKSASIFSLGCAALTSGTAMVHQPGADQ